MKKYKGLKNKMEAIKNKTELKRNPKIHKIKNILKLV